MVYVFMIKTLVILRCEPHRLHILGCASSVRAAQAFIFRHILGCASSPTFLRSSFAEGSLKVWGILNFKLGTSCKFAPAGVYFAI